MDKITASMAYIRQIRTKTMKNEELCLKLLVEKETNQVVFAEANGDFVDVLFSFMTIPIGRIIKLVGEESFGCMGNIRASVENLDKKFLQNQECRDMLLYPRSAAEVYCGNLKVNLNETDGNEYYSCGKEHCSVCFYKQDGHCNTWHKLLYKLKLPSPNPNTEGGVFMKSTTHFTVSSDLHVRPFSTMTGFTMLRNLEAGDDHRRTLEERSIKFGKDKVLELLKRSLASKRPLAEVFLDACQINFLPEDIVQTSTDQSQQRACNSTKIGEQICLKLIVDTDQVLYAEAEEDFVDLLCSFLTFPLGYLYKRFSNSTFNGCADNLYKSIQDIEVKLFESVKMKETLLDPKLVQGVALDKQVISIEEATGPSYTDLIQCNKASRHNTSSKPRNGEAKTAKGFIKGGSNFMVMDDLTVKPLCSVSSLTLYNGLKIPLSAIEEKEVAIGEDEALRLFMASLVSKKNALTAAFLLKEIKQEEKGAIQLTRL